MKKLLLSTFIILVIYACAEKKESALVGTWQLSQVLVDPGNGQGSFQKTNQDKVITFLADGTLKSNTSYCQMSKDATIGTAGSYSMNNSKLMITCDTTESSINFELKDGALILDYPTQCVEACKEKYVRVK